jgi:hypothetical protein
MQGTLGLSCCGGCPTWNTRTITQWQHALCRFTIIGHIGKLNGPKSWQVPVLPLTASERLHFKPTAGKVTTLYLAMHRID